jgi:hypothetical protein
MRGGFVLALEDQRIPLRVAVGLEIRLKVIDHQEQTFLALHLQEVGAQHRVADLAGETFDRLEIYGGSGRSSLSCGPQPLREKSAGVDYRRPWD